MMMVYEIGDRFVYEGRLYYLKDMSPNGLATLSNGYEEVVKWETELVPFEEYVVETLSKVNQLMNKLEELGKL